VQAGCRITITIIAPGPAVKTIFSRYNSKQAKKEFKKSLTRLAYESPLSLASVIIYCFDLWGRERYIFLFSGVGALLFGAQTLVLSYHRGNQKDAHLRVYRLLATIALLLGAVNIFWLLITPTVPPSAKPSHPSFKEYTATKYGFTMELPGNPTVSDDSSRVNGVNIPTTQYELISGNTVYEMGVSTYPASLHLQDTKAELQSIMNGVLQSQKGATLTDSHYEQIQGVTALFVTISAPQDGQIVTENIADLIKGDRLYNMVGGDVSQGDFNTFTHSLHFTNAG
jgi:hypothetical protein